MKPPCHDEPRDGAHDWAFRDPMFRCGQCGRGTTTPPIAPCAADEHQWPTNGNGFRCLVCGWRVTDMYKNNGPAGMGGW